MIRYVNHKRQSNFDQRIIYNRVPKCGSSTVLSVLRQLAMIHNFTYIHSKVFNHSRVSFKMERDLVMQLKTTSAPWLYDRHISVLNFTRFQLPMPHYINVFREPSERRMSFYYYRHPKRKTMTFDDCIRSRRSDCTSPYTILYYFCGHGENCLKHSRWSLQKAMNNVQKYYQVSSDISIIYIRAFNCSGSSPHAATAENSFFLNLDSLGINCLVHNPMKFL